MRTSKEARMYIEEEDPTEKKTCLPSDMEVKVHEALGNLAANEGSSITKVK